MVLRKAKTADIPVIWEILQHGIQQRKEDGSEQWQNGYPNEQTVWDDIDKDCACVLVDEDRVIAYAALIKGTEPAYHIIDGEWLNNDDYITVHRVAASKDAKGKGVGKELFHRIEALCINEKIYNIRVDNRFDNATMLKILERLKYTFCGDIMMNGAERRAYQKELRKDRS